MDSTNTCSAKILAPHFYHLQDIQSVAPLAVQSEASVATSASSELLHSASTAWSGGCLEFSNEGQDVPSSTITSQNFDTIPAALDGEALLRSLRMEDLPAIAERPLLEAWLRQSGPGHIDDHVQCSNEHDMAIAPVERATSPAVLTSGVHSLRSPELGISIASPDQQSSSPTVLHHPAASASTSASAEGDRREDMPLSAARQWPVSTRFRSFRQQLGATAAAVVAPMRRLKPRWKNRIVPL